MELVLQPVLYLAVLVGLAVPLGGYIAKAMCGQPVCLSLCLRPCERVLYRALRIDAQAEMDWKRYLLSALAFQALGLAALFAVLMLQGVLPGNPQGYEGLSWHLAFNTAVSFVTNTNWQTYSGEAALSNLSQAVGLTVQNFVSAACGIAVLFALLRGLQRVGQKGVGNFWRDLTRAVLYILLPISLLAAVILMALGVPQSLGGGRTAPLLEPVAVTETAEGYEIIKDAVIEGDTVTVHGKPAENAIVVTEEYLPLYP